MALQQYGRLMRWIIILIPALALAAVPGPSEITSSPDVVLTQGFLTPAQFVYMAEIENSPYRADVSALSADHTDQLGVNHEPHYGYDCDTCAIFDKNQHGYKVTLPIGWTFSNHFGITDRAGVVELTYWDPLENKPITLIAEMGFVHVPATLSTLTRSELEPGQVMYVSSSYVGTMSLDGEFIAALYTETAEFSYMFNDTKTVPIVLTEDGLVACLTGETTRYDPDFVERGEPLQIVDC